MILQRVMLAVCFILASVLGTGESVTTTDTPKYTCKTFGSGVVQPFNGSSFYVGSNCPFTLTRFTHNRVECDIIIRRGDSGLLVQVEIIINKVKTVLQDGSLMVEKKSVFLPYDHTYQHIFQYGIYTKLTSILLPLSVTWHSVPGGIDILWVELEQELSSDVTGLCGKHRVTGETQQLITESMLADQTCQTRDSVSVPNQECRRFFSHALDCMTLQSRLGHYIQLCNDNLYHYETSKYVGCAFFKELVLECRNNSYIWINWRSVTQCVEPPCPGDLVLKEQGTPYVPSCSNPNPRLPTSQHNAFISVCHCPEGKVLNDRAGGFRCVNLSTCPCVFAGKSYSPGDKRDNKCQSCVCESGTWRCSGKLCPGRCSIEGEFVTTYDGKQYAVPGKCTYVASQGPDWSIVIEFSQYATSLKTVNLLLFQERFIAYTFSRNMVKVGEREITELHQSDHALVFWKSSMYVQVHTSFGMKIQVQVFPDIQLYITPPRNHKMSGLCGNNNNDTTDDYTTSSGIIENSAQPMAASWSVGPCTQTKNPCINRDNEIFAEEKCSVLNNPTGIFAKCHDHISTDYYYTACIQRTCKCGSKLQECLCVSLDNYAKACAYLGIVVGDWRNATNCSLTCPQNQKFSYNIQVCNRTCPSLPGPDPRCVLEDAPVDGCGCPDGTHLNKGHTCTPKAECVCLYQGQTLPPGLVVIDGRTCSCKNGKLNCSKACGCRNGMVCVNCHEYQVNTTKKTCDSLNKPMGDPTRTCESGCYCPHDQYEDHNGNCVPQENCTCVYSGKVFHAGQIVKTKCKTCICSQSHWHCKDEPCPGTCQVYGNGQYQTFDSKWFHFDGHCQYTLVEDDCGKKNSTFSVRVQSVPCCDEALTCSRTIIFDLQGTVTLTLSDMRVTELHHDSWTPQQHSLYSVHTVGLYIIISVPSKGITLIWDKHTRITIELHSYWRNRVCGLCGNFDSNEINDLQISGSAVVSSPLAFGNSWKVTTPPCSDVTTEIFPCERNSYCSAWAQRRCMILTGDTFKDCHLKVDPEPYYHACVLESCSCEFEGKFQGFCTAVAAYAEACSDQDVCVKWRTPDLCPVFCDYYNEQGQCRWHYEACGEMLTCSQGKKFPHKLEGCYPRCPEEAPFYDENTGECTKLRNCTCSLNGIVIQPGENVQIQSTECSCENGIINCSDLKSTITPREPPPTTMPTTALTSSAPTKAASTTQKTWTTTPLTTTAPMTTITNLTKWSTTRSTTSTPTTTTSSTTSSTETFTFSTPTTTKPTTTTYTEAMYTSQGFTNVTTPKKTTFPTVTVTGPPFTSTTRTTTGTPCKCKDLKRKTSWNCGETWIEDCFNKTCTNETIVLTPVVCPVPTIPICPKQKATKVSDGCCETWKCDCRCELYGDPHYNTFQGTTFEFMGICTYILVEERSPRHHLTIAVDNFNCLHFFDVSCAKGIILKYQNNTATLSINTQMHVVQATLNKMTIVPPYEKDGLRFETTGYVVSIYLPEIRSYVSLSPVYNLEVSLAMEHFLNNTQGQCGVCGGEPCIRKGGQSEDKSCCDKTAYDWVYPDPGKPACANARKDVPCQGGPTPVPTYTTPCPAVLLCGVLRHPVFLNCSRYVDLNVIQRSCEFDSCRNGPCSSLEHAADECGKAGFKIEWRGLTNGSCNGSCPEGLVFREVRDKLDDFCNGGVRNPGAPLKYPKPGCSCPNDMARAGNHSDICVSTCSFCLGPLGEPKKIGDVWQSACHICTCNSQTLTECFPKPLEPPPVCSPNAVLVDTSCCGDVACVEKTCSYNGKTYKVGDRWKDAAYPCMSFNCSKEGIQTETKVCLKDYCQEEHRIWDDQHCCYTCNKSCAPMLYSISISVDNCTTVMPIPVCQGQCPVSQPRLVLQGDLQMEQKIQCCQERSSEKRLVTLQCSDRTTRHYVYQHITGCECGACVLQP